MNPSRPMPNNRPGSRGGSAWSMRWFYPEDAIRSNRQAVGGDSSRIVRSTNLSQLAAILAAIASSSARLRRADRILRETADPHCDARGDVAAVED